MDGGEMTRDEAIILMSGSASFGEWHRNAACVKGCNGGTYPGYWDEAIVLSGVMGEFSRRMEAQHNATVRAVYP
jgi:hypothetical protein